MPESTHKHTPGPWEYIGQTCQDESDTISGWFVKVASHRHISVEGRTRQEAEANARLIAAAPDMLEALIRADNIDQGWSGAVSRAIAKATTGEPR